MLELEIIDNLNIRRSSPISSLRAAINKKGYAHILRDRRQVYINPEDVKKLPEIIKVNFDETNYFIYPTTDAIRCVNCELEGHSRNTQIIQNPSYENNNINITNTLQATDTAMSTEKTDKTTTPSDHTNQCESMDMGLQKSKENNYEIPTNNLSYKRPLSLSTTTSSLLENAELLSTFQSSLDSFNEDKFQQNLSKSKLDTKNQRKKAKKESEQPTNIENELIKIKEKIENPENTFPLDYLKLKEFLGKSISNPQIVETVKEFCSNIQDIANMLRTLHPNLSSSNMKRRFTKIIKKIETSGKLHPHVDNQESTIVKRTNKRK